MVIEYIKQYKIIYLLNFYQVRQYFDNKIIVDYYIEVINFATKKVLK
tara:strand:+ start:12639 stop:12779 length:141 start_codon:yes stop_codon:yes gene_type:complete